MSVLHCLAGGGDDGTGWCGGCGCRCSDVSLLPGGTTKFNISLRHNVYNVPHWICWLHA